MESAAGIVIYRIRQNIEFLLVNDSFSNKRHWTPPKGKLIGQEDELKCAIRVVPDVTGLSVKDIQIEDGFRAEIKYLSGTKPKRAVFFLARLVTNVRIVPGGLAGLNIAWMQLKQASEKSLFKSMQDVLEQASVFIESTQHRHQAADASIPLNLQKLNLGRRSTGNNREGDKRYRRSLDEESRRPSSPARHRSQEGRGLFLGPNGAKNWRESPLNNDKQAWDENESPRHPSARTSNSQASNPLYKTRLCERYETEAHCPYGNRCTFAHGTVELRERPLVNDEVDKKDGPGSPLYKTRLCERFVKEGFCQYGPRCNFAHSPSELRERPNHAREGEKDNIQKEPIQQAPAPLKTKANGDVSHTATRSRTAPSTEPHPDTPAKVEVINNTKAPITASSTPPTPTSRGHLRDKSSLKDLLSGDDKSKPWMRIVELSDEERGNLNNSSPHPPPPPRAPLHPADEKANLLEEKLSQELARFINPGRLSVNEEIKEVTRMEFKHDLSKRQVFAVLLGALLLDSTYESAKIVNRVKLFQQFIRSRQDQVAFLKVWEKQVLRTRGLLSKVPLICKDLYDTDLVEEDTFLEWYRGIGSDELKKKAAPFVLWLQTAEEEEED